MVFYLESMNWKMKLTGDASSGFKMTFEGSYEGLNDDQYFCMVKPIQGNSSHGRWLEGPVNPLTKAERADYVARTIGRILKFLQME